MTNPNFSRPGAVDLSSLSQQAASTGGAARPGGGAYVLDVTEANLEEVISRSTRYPVVLELTSSRAEGADMLSTTLADLANQGQGRWLLGRVDCDAHPQIAQALQVQALPTVVALLAGQAMPLFQGVVPAEQVSQVIEQLLQAAVANGVAGRAEPVAASTEDGGDGSGQVVRDPRFAEADAAMESGDFAAAEQAFDALLKANPADSEAAAGKAGAGLWARATQLDPTAVAARLESDPKDVQAILDQADVSMVRGETEQAFSGLVAAIRTHFGDDREVLRERLVALFATLDAHDPVVLNARRQLATALF